MKQFFTALAANLVTIALCLVLGLIIIGGVIASVASSKPPAIRDKSILVVDLGRALSDAAAGSGRESPFEAALLSRGEDAIPLRSAIVALQEAIKDDRVSGVLVRGDIDA